MRGLLALCLAFILCFSCTPWKKEKEDKVSQKLRWEVSRTPRETKRTATTYQARPYATPTPTAETGPTGVPTVVPLRYKFKALLLDFEEGKLPFEFKGVGRRAKEFLSSYLTESGAFVLIEKEALGRSFHETPEGLWELWKALGVHVVIKAEVKELLTGQDSENAYASVRLEALVISTETGEVIKRAIGQNLLESSKSQGPGRSSKALQKALEEATKYLAHSIQLAFVQAEWNTSVADVKEGTVLLNAGKASGIRIGDEFEIFSPGELLKHPVVGKAIGRSLGPKKAKVKVEELMGNDLSKTRLVEGGMPARGDVAKPVRVL